MKASALPPVDSDAYEPAPDLPHGFRRLTATGEPFYSSQWLGDPRRPPLALVKEKKEKEG